jgi:hypothetical protein
MKLIKLKLQGPSVARVPSKSLRGALEMFLHGNILQRYFKHNQLSVIEVCQAVNRDVMLFFLIVWHVGISQLLEICNLLQYLFSI